MILGTLPPDKKPLVTIYPPWVYDYEDTIDKLVVFTNEDQTTGGDMFITVLKNGQETEMRMRIPAGSTAGGFYANNGPISVKPGDALQIKIFNDVKGVLPDDDMILRLQGATRTTEWK